MLKKFVSVVTLMILLLTVATVTFAQESTVKGNLGGIVADSSGAVLPEAKVTITGPTGASTMNSGADGRFLFPVLIPGMYNVRVEKQGFRASELKAVEISAGKTSSVSVTMQPGAANETVEVSAAAVTVDTTSSAIGEALNDTFYSKIPMSRNVTGLFYASAGVSGGGGSGAANPSISGGSGLENQYVADGVNITDGAFGGIGVYSRVYGSLGTGINLSFVKEVDVKTGGYEPQYGKSTGGLVQIVTKSGSNQFHGGVSAFLGPQQLEATRTAADDAGRLNQSGKMLHSGSNDVSGEIGGYVPGMKDHVFFFGSFNPSWNTQYSQLADLHGSYAYPLLGLERDLSQTTYSYATKLTWRLSDKHTLETSIFGDPTRSNTGPYNNSNSANESSFSSLANGTRNWVARYNGTMSPTWLVNASFGWGHNYLTETPSSPGVYNVADMTGCAVPSTSSNSSSCRAYLQDGTLNGPLGTPLSGIFARQGLGYYENTEGDNYSFTLDTQKVINKWGSHNVTIGYHHERSSYAGSQLRSGASFNITSLMASDQAGDAATAAQIQGKQSNAQFQLRVASAGIRGMCPGEGELDAPPGNCLPSMFIPGYGTFKVYLRQVRGTFSDPDFDTHGRYHAAYVNDAWTINKHVTASIGWRWEQQFMEGTPYVDATGAGVQNHYTFTDNWSPRIGLAIDPKGDRKTKIYGNFARYSYAIPLDMAIRSLSNEQDFGTTGWIPTSATVGGTASVGADGTMPISLDDAHYLGSLGGLSLTSGTAIAPGTRMQFNQEWVVGFQRELPKGIVVDIRWMDRRVKRIVEDLAGISPEAYQAGLSQYYQIGNPNAQTDLFVNPTQVDYAVGALPSNCPNGGLASTRPVAGNPRYGISPIADTFGNNIGAMCVTNAFDPATMAQLAGSVGKDGIPDGFVDPIHVYKAIEVTIKKTFANWMLNTNYRWSTLTGNYEGAFRNDNGQSDPSISSLFDFVRGDFRLLGNQFDAGFLNMDRRHVINSFASYTFAKGMFKNLTLGTGVRIESGIPINDLKAHPAYQNSGEIPVGGRGSLGRTSWDGQADLHTEYLWKLNEKHTLHFGADLFNITNQKTQLRVDQNEDRSYGVANADFLKPVDGTGYAPYLGYQRPFYARFNVKWVF